MALDDFEVVGLEREEFLEKFLLLRSPTSVLQILFHKFTADR
jgi:hypothetical protein